jgi:hypothetical protein
MSSHRHHVPRRVSGDWNVLEICQCRTDDICVGHFCCRIRCRERRELKKMPIEATGSA